MLLSFALLWVLWPFALRCCFFAGFTLEAARSRSMHETQAGLTERLYYTDAYLRTFDAHDMFCDPFTSSTTTNKEADPSNFANFSAYPSEEDMIEHRAAGEPSRTLIDRV